jgi:hypothetical protein
MADGVRFELTKGLRPRRFSRPVLSTAQPPIRNDNKCARRGVQRQVLS